MSMDKRWTCSWMWATHCRKSGSFPCFFSSTAAMIWMALRGLRTSWATPPGDHPDGLQLLRFAQSLLKALAGGDVTGDASKMCGVPSISIRRRTSGPV